MFGNIELWIEIFFAAALAGVAIMMLAKGSMRAG